MNKTEDAIGSDPVRAIRVTQSQGGRGLSILLAAFFPIALAVSLAYVREASSHLLAAGVTSLSVDLVMLIANAYLPFQWGYTFVRLQGAPVFPRQNYYGEADIAPEKVGRETIERRWLSIAVLVVLVSDLVLYIALPTQPVSNVTLACGVLFGLARSWSAMATGAAARLEEDLRGRYLLYLRSFRGARGWLTLATLMAADPFRVVIIVSPARNESRSFSWYLIASLFPSSFRRLHAWSTIDSDWHRVVASCMARSHGIIIDLSAMPEEARRTGLMVEAGMSVGFAGDHPTAYTVDHDKAVPIELPGPAVLKVGRSLFWVLQKYRQLVARLRAVVDRSLTDEEEQYLRDYYAYLRSSYADAMISDANLASREKRRDPHELLMSRNPMEALKARSTDQNESADD